MTFRDLFIHAGTGTVFTVFIGENASESIELLDSDLGTSTKEGEILNSLMSKNVIRYIPGKMTSDRLGCGPKRPHITVVLEAANCFRCAHRRGRSAIDPDIVWCEMKSSCNYHKMSEEGCKMFKEATKAELERNALFDYKNIPIESM